MQPEPLMPLQSHMRSLTGHLTHLALEMWSVSWNIPAQLDASYCCLYIYIHSGVYIHWRLPTIRHCRRDFHAYFHSVYQRHLLRD